MKLLVVGRTGQVASSLAERAGAHGATAVRFGRDELDLASGARLGDEAERLFEREAPDLIVNAAAYTAVDQAEDEADLAFEVNGHAPGRLASAARRAGVPFVHISTDYVFDGTLDRPYRPDDETAPVGVYGRSKEQGEREVREAWSDATILRTAWVTSPFGSNFVRTMLRLGETRSELSVVADQTGNPTSALEIADAIFAASPAIVEGNGAGTFHVAGRGEASWFDLARLVFDEAARSGRTVPKVEPITTDEYPTKAVRPANSALDTRAFEGAFGHVLKQWQEPQRVIVQRLLERASEGS